MKEATYIFEEIEGVTLVKFPVIENTGLARHCYSTRRGGVSGPPYDTLNPGKTTADSAEHILENRKRLEAAAGLPLRESIRIEHGSKVHVLRGSPPEFPQEKADSAVTDRPGAALTILYADCVPIFIVDRETPAVALVHGGWRSTAGHIVSETLGRMRAVYGTRPSACVAAVGPSICRKCFVVDEDVAALFRKTFNRWEDLFPHPSNINGKYHIDLWKLNERELLEAGLPRSGVAVSGLCTSCNPDLFYSYRRDGGTTGRMAAVIELKAPSRQKIKNA